ncbi:MAG: glycosyltransferase [Hyphomonadaceae bacterium]
MGRSSEDRAAWGDASDDREQRLARRLEDARALRFASMGLADGRPERSARTGLSPGQRSGVWALLGAAGVMLVLAPAALGAALAAILTAVFSAIICIRIAATIVALLDRRPGAPAQLADAIGAASPPTITILAPLHKEKEVAAQFVRAVSRLKYPADRLEVLLLVEFDDEETLEALTVSSLPAHVRIVPVPPGEPRTKPRALNYGLLEATGDLVGVYDAEDLPEANQLLEVVAAFQSGPKNLAVVQAPLAAHNGADSWIARQFEIEYAIHFRVWLSFLTRVNVPLTLGGTSNFFRRDRLLAAGGWDAWNVTEDADLGIRLARDGCSARIVHAPTLEEAPTGAGVWLRQRTRWMKGHMQTWLVLNRRPLDAIRELGLLRYLAINLVLGGSILAAAAHGPTLIWIFLAFLLPNAGFEAWHGALLGAGYGSVLGSALAAPTKDRPIAAYLLLPFYWPLMSVAAACALWELKTSPHYWAKTPHGRSRPPWKPLP